MIELTARGRIRVHSAVSPETRNCIRWHRLRCLEVMVVDVGDEVRKRGELGVTIVPSTCRMESREATGCRLSSVLGLPGKLHATSNRLEFKLWGDGRGTLARHEELR
jgi:hypothetical protein